MKLRAATVALEGGGVRGSGIIVSADGRIITAAHVAGRLEQPLQCTLSDGRMVPARTVYVESDADTAIVQITVRRRWPHVAVAKEIELVPGDWVFATGVPDSMTDRAGVLFRFGRVIRVREDSIQTDCPLTAGDSGGPLFDLEGRVVAVHGSIGTPLSWNYHVPLSAIEPDDGGLPDEALMNGPQVRAVLASTIADVRKSVVEVLCDGRRVALGTTVDADGMVVTKASSLAERISCRLVDGRHFPARILAVDREWDVALLQISATDLTAARWRTDRTPAVGSWLATPGADEIPIAVGVVGADVTASERQPGRLGIAYARSAEGLRVTHVVDGSAADNAGLQPGDVLTHAGGDPLGEGERLAALVTTLAAGDPLELEILRRTDAFPVRAVLELPLEQRLNRAVLFHRMGGELSPRRSGFPRVFPHTSPLKPADCGGPVVDLDGTAVGLNIARAGRTTSYAIPAGQVRKILASLKAGLSPSVAPGPK